MRQPEKIERLRPTLPALTPVRHREPAELHKTRLLRVQLQPEGRKSLPEWLHETHRIAAVLKPQDKVIGIPHDVRLAPGLPRSPLAREPVIEHVVQVHVRKQRRYRRPLRHPPHEIDFQSRVHDADAQPLSYQAQHPLVPDAHLQKRHQPPPVDAAEELPDVHLDNPADLAPFDRVGQCVQRVMRRTPRPEAMREAVVARFVNRVHKIVHHRPLNDLVLQRDDTERPYSPVRLGYLYPPHRLRPIRSPVTRPCRSSKRSSSPSPYSRHVTPSTPGAASRFKARYASFSTSGVMWCKSAMSFSPGWGPLLQRLRRGSRPLVRRLHRSYGPIRLLRIVHHRLRFTSLPDAVPAYDSSGQRAALQGPGDRRVRVHGFFDTAGPGHGSPVAPPPVLPSTNPKASAPQMALSMLNSPARATRYRRFTVRLATTRARLAE